MQLIHPAEVHCTGLVPVELHFPRSFLVQHLSPHALVFVLTLPGVADSESTPHSNIQVINKNID